MRCAFFGRVALAASLLGGVIAQQSVPDDLKAGFGSSGKELQVSYSGEAENGFQDGRTFGKDDVAQEPEFALGDSSGISTRTIYTVIMIDTSDDNARKLHYVRSNFKHSGGVNIASDATPLLEYKAPGTLGETGDERKYTFLLYTNPARKTFDSMQLPGDGENFDVKKFQTDNGLQDASAGIGMVVKLSGEVPTSSSTRRPASSTTAAASSSSQAESEPTSSAESEPTSSAAAGTTSSGSASATDAPEDTTASATGPTSNLAPATTLSTTAQATGASTSVQQPGASGSSSTSARPAEQTTSGGSLTSGMAPCGVFALGLLFSGVMAW